VIYEGRMMMMTYFSSVVVLEKCLCRVVVSIAACLEREGRGGLRSLR
jgi:hypothetical protein